MQRLANRGWRGPTVRDVAMAHRSSRPRHGLAKVLGDGFLYEHNAIFRVLRDAVLSCGFRFLPDRRFMLPVAQMLSLDEMLRSRVIPFRPSAAPVLRLASSRVGSLPFHAAPLTFPDRLMHESAHAVAECVLKAAPGSRHFLVRTLLGESFANACEVVAGLYCRSILAEIFFVNSSNLAPTLTFARALSAIGEATDEATSFRYAILCYLFANTLRDRVSDHDLRACFESTATRIPRARLGRVLRAVFSHAQNLNLAFRTQTTDFYLRYASSGRFSLRHARGMDVLRLARQADFQDAVCRLSAVFDSVWQGDTLGDALAPRATSASASSS